MANNKPIELLPLPSYSYNSPARPKRASAKPATPVSPNYSPARPVPADLLFKNTLRELGLNMRGKGGSYPYQSPEEIERSAQRDTIEETERERALQGIYELKNIVLFTKCATLCNDIQIYMKNDFALTIIYTIATLGTITIALSPIKEENIKNISYSYSDDEDDIDVIGNTKQSIKYDDDD